MRKRGRKSVAELVALPVIDQQRAVHRARSAYDETPPAPQHLSPEMRAFWIEVLNDHAIDAHRLGTLQVACEAWDRCQQARREVSKSGLSYTDDKGMIRCRPEVQIERDSRIAYLRALRELNIDTDPSKQKGSKLQPAALFGE